MTPLEANAKSGREPSMIRDGQERGKQEYRSKIDNRRCKVNGNLIAVSLPSLSGERDYDKHQTEQGRRCRRHREIEIRPSL